VPSVPLQETLWLALGVIVAGGVSGILAGLFGIGGGAVIVPALYEVFRILDVPEGVRMQLCIGTSLAIMVPTSIRSYLAHRSKGAVISDVVLMWSLSAVVGAVVGSLVAVGAPAALFKVAFIIFATLIGMKMLFGSGWRARTSLPGRVAQFGYGFLTGLVSSLVGVSGGSVSNAVLTLYGQPIQQAVATSAGIGVPITIVGTIGYVLAGWSHLSVLPPLSLGFVSLIGWVLMAPVSSYAASYGARMAHRLSKRQLENSFGIFLLLLSARFIASLL
jgi:uncharacterized membrane protein YfcA